MCGISLILSGIHIVSLSSNIFNGLQRADFVSSLQEGKRTPGTLYPTVDDLKELVSRRGPDHIGLERLLLKVVSGHEPRIRKGEHQIENQENNYILDETSYRSSEANEKWKTSVQITSDSETRISCCQMNNIESSSQECTKKYSACSSDLNQATKSSIVCKFVEGINGQTIDAFEENTFAEMLFLGATLQLRGVHPVYQPLVDSWTNVLVYNGEVFGGISVAKEENDTIILMNALQRCCSCPCHANGRDCPCCHLKDHISVPQLLSTVKGPWSLIYWQAKSNILWFGRDAFGRRSLLIHWPSLNDSRFLLSSAAPFKSAKKTSCGSCGHKDAQHQTDDYIERKEADGSDDLQFWDELVCGIYSISLETGKGFGNNEKDLFVSIVGIVEKHDWCNSQMKNLLKWERCFVDPGSNDIQMSKFTCSHIGNDIFYGKENGMISSFIEKKDVKLGYVEHFDQSLMRNRTATEDKYNQENKKMIYINDARQLLIDQGLESEANQLFQGMDCFPLNPDLQQNNAKAQGFLDTVDSHTLLLSHKVWLDTITEKISSSSTSMESPGLQEKETTILQDPFTSSAQRVLFALKRAVMRRTCQSQFNQIREGGEIIEKHVPIAVLFSGGLDSMVLAALLNQCLYQNCEIDLLNVSFDGAHAPDRISAKAGLIELQRIAPFRRWHLVEIDADPCNLEPKIKYLTSLIHPAKTYMDLNIGTALWVAACGDGWVEEEDVPQGENKCRLNDSYSNGFKKSKHIRYKSQARILLVGSGADEQCAGYGRHRTQFRLGGWVALQEEMKIDVQRIWKRNLGRDDRCIADHGKEARFPFLDEDVIETLLDLPLWEIADLEKPSGQGDKKILRQVAQLLGLEGASTIPKRAIQFGSRIARESNRRNFGSNRAANQASAGTAVIHCLTE